jgi:mono/diheme cytochrome c family protein
MKKSFLGISLILGVVILYNSCYFDKKEALYPVLTGACDTSVYTYSGSVQNIFNTYCNSCHSSSLASGGVILDTYSGAHATAVNGQLIPSLSGSNGGQPTMPPNAQLDDCKITTLTKWVEAGAPNN